MITAVGIGKMGKSIFFYPLIRMPLLPVVGK
jgi:hypothetical protein